MRSQKGMGSQVLYHTVPTNPRNEVLDGAIHSEDTEDDKIKTPTWTIMVSILSGLNLSLYLEREWASPSSIAVISLSGKPVKTRIYLNSTLTFEVFE